MNDQLPELYFRLRETGAFVFRIDTENRQGRLDLEQIAVINIRNGEIKPHGQRVITPAERAGMERWILERRQVIAARTRDDIARTIERINLAAHWAQSQATDAEIEAVSAELLLAIHDLRSVIVGRKSDMVTRGNA